MTIKTENEVSMDAEAPNQAVLKQKRGFAAMSPERVKELGKKGGASRVAQLGREGYVAIGRKGGAARAAQLGHEGYVAMGKKKEEPVKLLNCVKNN